MKAFIALSAISGVSFAALAASIALSLYVSDASSWPRAGAKEAMLALHPLLRAEPAAQIHVAAQSGLPR